MFFNSHIKKASDKQKKHAMTLRLLRAYHKKNDK